MLVDPKKDRTLQAAVKGHRVMTLKQNLKGTQTDRGEVGFDPGRSRQYLIFPKSLKSFEGRSVVGIRYELFTEAAVQPKAKPKAQKQSPRGTRKPGKPKRQAPEKRAKHEPPPKDKIIPFQPEKEEVTEDEDPKVSALKAQVRRAMSALKQGKQVAAFNLLQKIVGDQ